MGVWLKDNFGFTNVNNYVDNFLQMCIKIPQEKFCFVAKNVYRVYIMIDIGEFLVQFAC